MSGRTGMHHASPRRTALRRDIWRSMRIMRCFTLPQLQMTTGASYGNCRKFVSGLVRHGFVSADQQYTGGRSGVHQQFRLVGMNGPDYPTLCPRCGRSLAEPCERETERQGPGTGDQGPGNRETETERQGPGNRETETERERQGDSEHEEPETAVTGPRSLVPGPGPTEGRAS